MMNTGGKYELQYEEKLADFKVYQVHWQVSGIPNYRVILK